MKEEIDEIAKSIKKHRELEIENKITNCAILRSKTLFDGKELELWLVNEPVTQSNIGQYIINQDGTVIQNYQNKESTLKEHGKPITRDFDPIGSMIVQNHEGVHEYKTPKGIIKIEFLNRASYIPISNKNILASDLIIRIAGDKNSYSYKNIDDILKKQNEIDLNKKKLESLNESEAKDLLKKIEIQEKEKNELINKAQIFIRNNAELRYQPILDPTQDKMRRSNIFKGNLIINGGPGTGKTTSLIQRIKYLIYPENYNNSEYINDDVIKLTQDQKNLIQDQNTSWIFYAPNELLALYLRNSMNKEHLISDNRRVKVWSQHKNELIKAYKLFDPVTQRPFLKFDNSDGISLLENSAESTNLLIDVFFKFSFLNHKEKIQKIIEINLDGFNWKSTGNSIKKYLNDKPIANIDDLIRLYINLNEIYRVESENISGEYTNKIKLASAKINVEIVKFSERIENLKNFLSINKQKNNEIDEDEIEEEDLDEILDKNDNSFEVELYSKIKTLIRKVAIRLYDKNTKLNKNENELLILIPEIVEIIDLDLIGQGAYYKKYFEKLTKGVPSNIFREIPMVYKNFRRDQLNKSSQYYNLELLNEIVIKKNNIRIHPDEQALLLILINRICNRIAKSFKQQFENISHSYLNAYKENIKPVIAIDEATDFSIIDLLAISSFEHPSVSTITLCGDVMQRMTNDGIQSWDDFKKLVPNTEICDLNISYRQSPTLLELAHSIYEKYTGIKANFKSYINRNESEPKPLLFIEEEEINKIEWIADRIIEIYKAYGDSIPSIAIFLPNEDLLDTFANKLGRVDKLSDVGIDVKACKDGAVLGYKDTVRVFSIDKIKGLEFEAVFFHNLDYLQNNNIDSEMLLKYLYVGLSRATFYLGVTLNKQFSENLNFLKKYFDDTKDNWSL